MNYMKAIQNDINESMHKVTESYDGIQALGLGLMIYGFPTLQVHAYLMLILRLFGLEFKLFNVQGLGT